MTENGESQYLSVIRVWAALAWADGVIADAEAEAIRRLIRVAELSDSERETATSWLENRVELDVASISGLSDSAKAGIYRAAVRLAAVDLEVADEERSYLSRLRAGLDISDMVAQEIEDQIFDNA